MSIDWDIALKVFMPLVSLFLGAWIKNALEAKVRLIVHYGHVSAFKLKGVEGDDQDRWVYTHSVVIKNNGRKPAFNLRLGHNVLPDNTIVQPDIEYSINVLPGGSKEMIFPILSPKKEITVSYLYYPPLTYGQINTHVESDAGAAKPVNVLLQPVYSKWVNYSVLALMLIGAVTVVYLLVVIVIWLVNM